jgi:nitrite reductase/ring-hydroxylating ferredoxin subunit
VPCVRCDRRGKAPKRTVIQIDALALGFDKQCVSFNAEGWAHHLGKLLAYERVANLNDIPHGRGLCVEIGPVEVGLFRVDGAVYAMENRCPHGDAQLSEGDLAGCVIVCPAHGWDFDVTTGFKPGDPDGFPIPCFAVRIDGDDVSVDVDDVINMRRRR